MRWVWLAAAALVLGGVWAWRLRPPDPTPAEVQHRALRGPTAEEEGDFGLRSPSPTQAAREDRSSQQDRKPPPAGNLSRKTPPTGGPRSRKTAQRGAVQEALAPRESSGAARAHARGANSGSPDAREEARAGGVPREAARRAPPKATPAPGESPGAGQGGTGPGLTGRAPGGPSEGAGSGPQAGRKDGPPAGEPEPQESGPADPGPPAGPAESAPALGAALVPPTPVYAPLPQHPGTKVEVHPSGGFTAASAVGREGRVRVRLLVKADGTVGGVDVLASSGDRELDQATVAAVSRWRFDPARRGDTPVDSYYVVWVRFVVGP